MHYAVMALLLSSVPPNGAMQLVAKRTERPSVALQVTDARILSKNGLSAETVTTQVEASLRRCGFSIADWKSGGLFDVTALILLNGLDTGRGYAGSVILSVQTFATVEGLPDVPLAVFTDGMIFSGPPGTAGIQAREALSTVLDSLCNAWLRARDSARRGSR
jgi:hypothetical protein